MKNLIFLLFAAMFILSSCENRAEFMDLEEKTFTVVSNQLNEFRTITKIKSTHGPNAIVTFYGLDSTWTIKEMDLQRSPRNNNPRVRIVFQDKSLEPKVQEVLHHIESNIRAKWGHLNAEQKEILLFLYQEVYYHSLANSYIRDYPLLHSEDFEE
jgi:abortive infection bacteriophage resistance protein